jgi:hypothetical protein
MAVASDGNSVAAKGRISIDVSDMREEIENFRGDESWKELALAAKIRVLLRERLKQKPES